MSIQPLVTPFSLPAGIMTYSPACEVHIPSAERSSLIQLARDHFGYENIHEYQLNSAYAMLTGIDSSVIVGTGAGKSLCYALAALAAGKGTSEKKMVIVISPLIALMKDQVGNVSCLLEKNLTGMRYLV
jgi:superfamily II DNA helicase RecQ